MIVPSQDHCDVLVIGAGIAGICAAIAAAKEGCAVVLTSSTEIFSGSSFFPGTWGLGLIGPVDAADEDDLAASIARVGAGMTTPALVKTFVHKINPAINVLKARGIRLRTAEKSDEKEFIPCFDHKRRNWNGLEAARMRAVFQKELAEYGVRLCPHHEALELVQHSGRVCGAVFAVKNRLLAIRSKAVVLATGGYSGLFQNCLTTADVTGTGHALALRAGARPCGRRRAADCPDRRADVPAHLEAERVHGGLWLLRPKTVGSLRRVAVPAALADALAEHLAAARPTRFVFESAPGLPVDPRADHRAWRAALAEEGLPAMSLHSARHTCATLLLEAGVPLRTAQEILGQTQALTTARYQHPSLAAQASALDAVAGAMT